MSAARPGQAAGEDVDGPLAAGMRDLAEWYESSANWGRGIRANEQQLCANRIRQVLADAARGTLKPALAAQEPKAAPGIPLRSDAETAALLRADLADAEAQLARWPRCPAGCNCRIGIDDDPDRNECGCDGPCNGGEQPAPGVAALDALEKVVSSHERVMYAALIDIRRGDPGAARQLLVEQLASADGPPWNGPSWNGTGTGAEWLEQARREA